VQDLSLAACLGLRASSPGAFAYGAHRRTVPYLCAGHRRNTTFGTTVSTTRVVHTTAGTTAGRLRADDCGAIQRNTTCSGTYSTTAGGPDATEKRTAKGRIPFIGKGVASRRRRRYSCWAVLRRPLLNGPS